MFAVITFFLNFIPNIGSLIAILLPAPVAILQFGLGFKFAMLMIILGGIQFAIGNVLDPKLMGENLGLHPVVVLLALLFWGFIWGVPGMFLSVPMTAIIKLILSRYPATKPVAGWLEGNI